MIDMFEQSNNGFFPFNNEYKENIEGYNFEEKNTSFSTLNQYNYENNFQFPNDFSSSLYYSDNENDNENHLLNKKTKRDEDIKHENTISNKDNNNNNIFIVENKLSEKEELKKINNKNINNNKKLKNEESRTDKKDKKSKFGRKNKESGETGKHDKNSEDNMINKIKKNFFNDYIRNVVKENSLSKDIDLKKLPTKFIADLTKQNNKRLFNMKIKDILCEQPISTKYSKFDSFVNKLIIEKIYKEKKEINVIKILELTFEELFIIYRIKLNKPKDIEYLEEIKDKIKDLDLIENENKYKDIGYLIKELKKNNESEYIENVKSACLKYKKWFIDKSERKSD